MAVRDGSQETNSNNEALGLDLLEYPMYGTLWGAHGKGFTYTNFLTEPGSLIIFVDAIDYVDTMEGIQSDMEDVTGYRPTAIELDNDINTGQCSSQQ